MGRAVGKAGEYTEGELWLAVRQERAALTAERTTVVKEIHQRERRLGKIDERLLELDKAEDLLEGGL